MHQRSRKKQRSCARGLSFTVILSATLLSSALLAGCSKPAPSSSAKLVLVIAVDQFAYQYINRFRPHFTGGLKMLIDRGALFTSAHYHHADTSTCPGHASIVTGVHPARSGIISNEWFDRASRRGVYCVENDRYGRSPHNLLVSSLPDWVKKQSWSSKVFSASAKDRSAVILGGHKANAAYWYDKKSGGFVSSSYYRSANPEWLVKFNKQRLLAKHFGELWEPQSTLPEDLESLSVTQLDQGLFPNTFPHHLGGLSSTPGRSFYEAIYGTPFIDEHLAELAKILIREEKLGQDSNLDYLGLSFSALDVVGHRFGPNSLEAMDTLLSLDQTLETLFKFVDKEVGLKNVLVALTGDHGVQPYPEYLQQQKIPARRISSADVACIQAAGRDTSRYFQTEKLFLSPLTLNENAIKQAKIKKDDVETFYAAKLKECNTVEKIWMARELSSPSDTITPIEQMYRNSFHPERSADLMLQLKEHHSHSMREGTNHGSPYSYDTHVPVILFGPGISPKEVTQPIKIVDLAPTLSELLGVSFPDGLDGMSQHTLVSE